MSALLVPMILDTAVVRPGAPEEPFARTAYATPAPPPRAPGGGRQPRVRQAIVAPPFEARVPARAPGVHLHWALPDPLTRFDAESSKLPPLPSRWLVVRIGFRAGAGAPARTVTAWLQPNVHDPANGWVRGGHTQHHVLGRSAPPLTTRGQGATRTVPDWAFYADNVQGRLAFQDTLDHPDDAGLQGPLAYLVAGWYTHTQLDPLAPQAGRTVWEILDDLRWAVDRALPIDPPDRVIVHGSALAIAWPSAAPAPGLPDELELQPDATKVTTVMADTLTAATAELAFPDAAPAIAEAVVANELDELDGPDGLARLDGTRHQLRFRAVSTGRGESDVIFQSEGAPGPSAAPPPVPVLDPQAVRADHVAPQHGSFGELRAAFAGAGPPAPAPAADDSAGDLTSLESGELVPVRHPSPRRWEAVDPVLAFGGLGRSLRYGHDGRYDPVFGTLPCRRTGETLLTLHQPARPVDWAGIVLLGGSDPAPANTWVTVVPGSGERVAAPVRLPGAIELPAELEALVHELDTLDPGGAPGYAGVLAGTPNADASAAVAARLDWWTLWDDVMAWRRPPAGRFSILGTPPCPLAVTRPSRAWVALHVDWRLTWTPLVRGAAALPLGELDFEPPESWPSGPSGGQRTLSGRGVLNDGPLRLLKGAHERGAGGGLPAAPLLDAAGCSLDGFLERVRGVPEGLWLNPDGIDDTPPDDVIAGEQYAAVPVAAGAWQLQDLRVVDAFGRVLGLVAGGVAAGPQRTADDVQAAGAPGVVQRPRFTSALTVDARFLDPTGAVAPPRPGESFGRPVEVDTGQNPLVGWLAPAPVDGSAELFDAGGRSLGRLEIERRTLCTEFADTPSADAVATGVTDPVERLSNPVLARVARSLVAADRLRAPVRRGDSALGSLLRLVNDTLRYVDATGGTGTGHLALLLGSPLAIVRVGITVDADDPQARRGGSLAAQLAPVRVGSLTRLNDGVVAFWVEDQPDRVYPAHPLLPAQAAPLPGDPDTGDAITHPYVASDPVVWVQPGRMRTLTALVAPGAELTFTSGLGPRKALDFLPEWTDGAAALTPTLAFDSVVRAVDAIALPVADDINGVWTWYRRAPGESAWTADEVPAELPAGTLGDQPSRIEDGYLRVRLLPPPQVKGVEFQVTCIRRYGPANTIQELGVRNPDGSVQRLPIDEAIRLVEIGRVRFYVEVSGQRAYLVVDVAPSGRKFLRTTFDTTTVNNLAGLPAC